MVLIACSPAFVLATSGTVGARARSLTGSEHRSAATAQVLTSGQGEIQGAVVGGVDVVGHADVSCFVSTRCAKHFVLRVQLCLARD